MTRRALIVIAVAALAAPGVAQAAGKRPAHQLHRPNPIFTSLPLDYINPLPTPSGGVAVLPPLSERATAAAVLDGERLAYRIQDDLGGFVPAPIGQFALSSGGREVVGTNRTRAEIPLYQHHAGGKVNAFTFIGGHGPVGPGDNGKQPVPGLNGPPPVVPPPTTQAPPPANQGFGGQTGQQGNKGGKGGQGAGGQGTGGGGTGPRGGSTGKTTQTGRSGGGGTGRGTTTRPTTSRRTTTRQTTTQATVSTSTTTPTTTPTTTTTGGGGGGGGGGGADCGGDGISITPDPSNPNGCIIKLFNAKPGDEEHEVLTIKNVSTSPYTLALRAGGEQNHLWHDLRMGVWQAGTPTPNPLPPLLFWTPQYNDLVTLNPGDSIQYEIELYLPIESGNSDMNLTAIINFKWRGH